MFDWNFKYLKYLDTLSLGVKNDNMNRNKLYKLRLTCFLNNFRHFKYFKL